MRRRVLQRVICRQRRAVNFKAQNNELVAAGAESVGDVVGRWSREEPPRQLNDVNVATALHLNAKGVPFAEELFVYLCDQLEVSEPAGGPQWASNLLYGLQNTYDGAHVRRLLEIVLPRVLMGDQKYTAKQIANALYGLRFQPPTQESREIIGRLAEETTRTTDKFSCQAIGNAVYGLHRHTPSKETLDLLHAVTKRLDDVRDMDSQSIGASVLGLGHHDDSREVRAFVGKLTEHVAQRKSPLDTVSCSHVLLGLRGQRGTPATRQMLLQVSRHLRNARQPFTVQMAACSLYGLQNQQVSPEVGHLIVSLGAHLRVCRGDPTPQEVSIALYGLNNLVGGTNIGTVLDALARLIPRCRSPLSPSELAGALFGLRKLDVSDEVGRVFAALLPFAEGCTGTPDGHALSSAISGLSTQGDTQEARQMLTALAHLAERTSTPLVPREVGSAIYGLNAFGDSPESRTLLRALTGLIPRDAQYADADLGSCFYGLRGLGASPEARELLREVLGPAAGRLSDNERRRVCGMCLQALMAMGVEGADTEALVKMFADSVSSTEGTRDVGGGIGAVTTLQSLSLLDKEVPDDVRELAENNREEVEGVSQGYAERTVRLLFEEAQMPGLQFNVIHDTGFEMDLLRDKVNVELDGRSVSYRAPGKLLVKDMRDSLLAKHGYSVHRIRTDVDGKTRPLAEVVEDIAEALGAASATGSVAAAW
eukprot:Hpha_TRINITY_DN25930_c0_g1::TRINITY_DN25930_c0_g1_i1::g.185227::m.185227